MELYKMLLCFVLSVTLCAALPTQSDSLSNNDLISYAEPVPTSALSDRSANLFNDKLLASRQSLSPTVGEDRSSNPQYNLLGRDGSMADFQRIWVNCLNGQWGTKPDHQIMFCGLGSNQFQSSDYYLKTKQCSTLCSCDCTKVPTCQPLLQCTGFMVKTACFTNRNNAAGCYCDDGTYPFWKKRDIEAANGSVQLNATAAVTGQDDDKVSMEALENSTPDASKLGTTEGGIDQGGEVATVDNKDVVPTPVQKAYSIYNLAGWPFAAQTACGAICVVDSFGLQHC